MRKSLLILFAACTLFLGVAGSVSAGTSEPPPVGELAEVCANADQTGLLEAFGVTRGECVNFLKAFTDQANPRATNFVAGMCGSELFRDILSAEYDLELTNKGQCIKAMRDIDL